MLGGEGSWGEVEGGCSWGEVEGGLGGEVVGCWVEGGWGEGPHMAVSETKETLK